MLFADLGDSEQVLFKVAGDLLPAVISGVMVAAVLSAIMSTADSLLVVASSALVRDWYQKVRHPELFADPDERPPVVTGTGGK